MLNNKKTALGFICAGIVAIVAGIIVGITHPTEYSTHIPQALDEAVARSIFTYANVSPTDTTIDGKDYRYVAVTDTERFYNSECLGEGHIILGSREKGGTVEVYALCSLAGYGFRNGMLVDNSGSSCTPTLITFEKNDSGAYNYKKTQEAEDGGHFASSVRKMFPPALANKAISAQGNEEYTASLREQCDRYAEAYLKVLGRDAEISSYREQNFLMLSDYGVFSDVENVLCDLHPEYGFYLGSLEFLEADGRYVYSVKWDGDDNGNGTVTYTKTRYDNDKAVEKFAYKVEGERFTEIKPKKKKK